MFSNHIYKGDHLSLSLEGQQVLFVGIKEKLITALGVQLVNQVIAAQLPIEELLTLVEDPYYIDDLEGIEKFIKGLLSNSLLLSVIVNKQLSLSQLFSLTQIDYGWARAEDFTQALAASEAQQAWENQQLPVDELLEITRTEDVSAISLLTALASKEAKKIDYLPTGKIMTLARSTHDSIWVAKLVDALITDEARAVIESNDLPVDFIDQVLEVANILRNKFGTTISRIEERVKFPFGLIDLVQVLVGAAAQNAIRAGLLSVERILEMAKTQSPSNIARLITALLTAERLKINAAYPGFVNTIIEISYIRRNKSGIADPDSGEHFPYKMVELVVALSDGNNVEKLPVTTILELAKTQEVSLLVRFAETLLTVKAQEKIKENPTLLDRLLEIYQIPRDASGHAVLDTGGYLGFPCWAEKLAAAIFNPQVLNAEIALPIDELLDLAKTIDPGAVAELLLALSKSEAQAAIKIDQLPIGQILQVAQRLTLQVTGLVNVLVCPDIQQAIREERLNLSTDVFQKITAGQEPKALCADLKDKFFKYQQAGSAWGSSGSAVLRAGRDAFSRQEDLGSNKGSARRENSSWRR